MSHITDVRLQVADLDALAEACERLGLELKKGQKTYRWYGRFLADSEEGREAAKRFDASTFGKCDHAIAVKGDASAYEIGLVSNAEGSYDLLYDGWSSQGRRLEAAAGAKLSGLRREYAAAVAVNRARAKLKDWKVERQDFPSGAIRLKLRRR